MLDSEVATIDAPDENGNEGQSVQPVENDAYATVYLQGGLGNQLFQLFAAMAYAKRHGKPLRLEKIEQSGGFVQRPVYWETFLSALNTDYFNPTVTVEKIHPEPSFTYTELPKLDVPVKFHGYFQSELYFADQYPSIVQELRVLEQRFAIARHLTPTDGPTASLHFRLGDYKRLPYHHPVLGFDYYVNAVETVISRVPDLTTVLYFFDPSDTEDTLTVNQTVTRLQERFPTIVWTPVPSGLHDYEELLLMSACDHHIIANSSFSWWGAYLNPSTTKLVCYPDKWFGPALGQLSTATLFPPTWVSVSTPAPKLAPDHLIRQGTDPSWSTVDLRQTKIVILHTKNRTDRAQHVQCQLDSKGLRYTFHHSTPDQVHYVGCCKGFMSLYERHLLDCEHKCKFEPILVLENDISTTNAYVPLIPIPNGADAIYLGISKYGLHPVIDDMSNLMNYDPVPSHEGLIRVKNMLSAHAVLITSTRFLLYCLRAAVIGATQSLPPDVFIARNMGEYNVYALKEPLFYQDAVVGGQEAPTLINVNTLNRAPFLYMTKLKFEALREDVDQNYEWHGDDRETTVA